MGARETLSILTAAGFTLRLSAGGDKVQISPLPVPDELVALVRADKPELIEILASDDQYPMHPVNGAPFMPWCAPIPATEFVKWRGELIAMIEELAGLEYWDREDLDDVLTRAIYGPVSDLRPNWHHFNERLGRAIQDRNAETERRARSVSDGDILKWRGKDGE